MAESVKIEDMDINQLKTAVNSLLQQLQNADATIRDLGAKVANKEIENSRLRSVLEASQQAMQQPVVEEE
jgi:regulator of replication initiation timing